MRRWRVVFQLPDRLPVTILIGSGVGGSRTKCDQAFASSMREAMSRGGCRGFEVTVHPDGPDCDHEVGGPPDAAA